MEQPNHIQVPSGNSEASSASSYTSFPYGLSGVAVSEPAYYADYGRKSRMCMYCGKIFTRSTTRRYHEVKCRSKQKAASDYSSNNQIPHSILNDVNFSPSSSHQSSVSPLDFVPPGGSATPDLARTLNTSLFDHRLPPTSSRSLIDVKGYGDECRRVDMKSYDSDDSDDRNDLLRKSSAMEDSRCKNNKSSEREVVDNGTNDAVITSPITSPVTPPQMMEKETLESVLGIATPAVPLCISRTSPLSTFPIVSMANMASMASLVNFHEQASLMRTSPTGLNLHVNPPYSPEMLLATSNVMAAMSFPWRPEDSLERRYNVSTTSSPPPLEPFRCEICGKVLQSASLLTLHKRTHMKIRPYPCRICGSRFTTLSSRRSHERTHLGEKPYFCVVCGTRFTRKYSLKLHENKHVDGPYKCSHCFKMCDTVADLKDHLQCHSSPSENSNHTNKPPGSVMNDDDSDLLLKSPLPYLELNHHHHQQHHHHHHQQQQQQISTSTPTSTSTTITTTSTLQDGDLTPSDKVCSDSLLSPKHEQKESDEDMSDDNSNDNSSSSDIMLDGKILSDSGGGGEDGEKTQRCEQCGEEFPHAYLLKIHVKVHASKPFECPVCGKKFGYRNNMKTHVKCHFGLKPHVCHICGSRFTRASTLRRHIEKHQAQGDTSNFCFDSSPVDSQASVCISTSNIVTSALTSSGLSLSPSRTRPKIPTVGPLWLPSERSGITTERGDGFQPLPAFSTFQNLATSASSYRMTPPTVVGMPQLALTPDSPPQTQALNLTVPAPKKDDLLQGEGDPKHWGGPESDISDMLAECDDGNNNNNISKSDSSDRETIRQQVKPMFENFGVQVNTCGCGHLAPLHISEASEIKLETDREFSSAAEEFATPCSRNIPKNTFSPSPPQSAQEDFTNMSSRMRTLLSLVQRRELFVCEFCECYFMEYAMLRIHKRMHAMGTHKPFVCAVCGEDCHDKVYFSLHMSEHLK